MSEPNEVPQGRLEMIRNLLAKAEATEFEGEREALNAKARELIAKYGIDMALLAAAGKIQDKVGDRVVTEVGPFSIDKVFLLYQIAKALRCEAVRKDCVGLDEKTGTLKRVGYSLHMFGMDSDLERVELLYTSLLIQMSSALFATPVPPWENAKSFRKSWLTGYAATVNSRLVEAERRAAAETPTGETGVSTALVLVDRTALVTNAYRQRYPKTTMTARSSATSSGYGHGAAAGRRADLGGTRVGSGSNGRGALSR